MIQIACQGTALIFGRCFFASLQINLVVKNLKRNIKRTVKEAYEYDGHGVKCLQECIIVLELTIETFLSNRHYFER